MLDGEVWTALSTSLATVLTSLGYSLAIKKNYTPISQGPDADNNPTVYIHRISFHRHGWQAHEEEYNESTELIDVTEKWTVEAHYQASILADVPLTDNAALTPVDYADATAAAMQTQAFVALMAASDVYIGRITDVTVRHFIDDRSQWDNEPVFEFWLTYVQTAITQLPPATITGNVIEVTNLSGA